MLDRWFRKEMPLQGMGGMAGGLFGRVIGGSTKVAASGGTTYVPGDGYKYHLFESDANFVVTASGLVDVFLVGAGGGRGQPAGNPPGSPSAQGSAHGGGSGGAMYTYGFTVTTGTWTVDIGGAGQNTLGNQSITPGGTNGGGAGGMGRKGANSPSSPGNFNQGGAAGGGFSRIYSGGVTIAAGGGGGGGKAYSAGYGSGTPQSTPFVSSSTTTGRNADFTQTGQSGPPGGNSGGGGSGGGFNGSGGGGGGAPNPESSGYGGSSYSNPNAESFTLYIGTNGAGSQGNTGVSPAPLPTAPGTKWIPQEPTTAGRGSNTTGRERSSSPNWTDSTPGYVIVRYLT